MVNRRSLIFLSFGVLATPASASRWQRKLVLAAEAQVGLTVLYDSSYVRIAYPLGDVPEDRGVCTDVVIRAYRSGLGFDLQKAVHEDMAQNFAAYPKLWGLTRADSNIDHRRVPNLQTYFERKAAALPVSRQASGYEAGDLVTMRLPGNLPHIAIVSATPNAEGTQPLLIHNIGGGARKEDALFTFPVTGHYRFSGA